VCDSAAVLSLVIVISLSLVGCDTLRKRKANETSTPPNRAQPLPGPTPGPALIPGSSAPSVVPGNTVPPPVPAATPAPLREAAKIGLILGPGGLKAFAHLGVLRELHRARVPIHSVVGLEWGAIIGGLYSIQGQINDAEWKAFKLREGDVPGEGGFLRARLKPQPISALQNFLEASFGGALIEKARISFACPSGNAAGDPAVLLGRGSFRDAMSRCVPYPPLYFENRGQIAAPFSVGDAASWLRSRGANVILLVNVLGQGEILPEKIGSEQPGDAVLWAEIRRELYRAKTPQVNHIIHVNTTGHAVTDFDGRRALIDAGQRAATEVVNKMALVYGF
jgi:NTE family protein